MKLFVGARPLTTVETDMVAQFYIRLTKAVTQRKAVTLFRGESLEMLRKKLGLDEESGTGLLSERLFMYGDKARYFFSESYFGKPPGESYAINDTGRDVLHYIFNRIAKSLRTINPIVQGFYKRNAAFASYFKLTSNRENFITTIHSLDPRQQLAIRNYYLKLLHQIADGAYKQKSHMLSTSKDYAVGRTFSKGKGNQTSVVLHCWNVYPFARSHAFSAKELPKYTGTPYPQEELSLMGGILPHYIIGLEIVQQKRLLVNPWMFRKPITAQTVLDGFDIDQSDFVSGLALTGYGRYFNVFEDEVFEISHRL